MLILSETIHRTWKQKKVFTGFYLDVTGAFNNVRRERLIDDLRMR